MKLIFLLLVVAFVFFAASPSEPANMPGEKDNVQPCCNQYKCIEKENSGEPDDISLFQFSPFNI
jgi:hypothetical protein